MSCISRSQSAVLFDAKHQAGIWQFGGAPGQFGGAPGQFKFYETVRREGNLCPYDAPTAVAWRILQLTVYNVGVHVGVQAVSEP